MRSRLRIYSVTEDWIAQWLRGTPPPIFQSLPPDAKFVSVHANWECKSIDVMLSHNSFEKVVPGQAIRRIFSDD